MDNKWSKYKTILKHGGNIKYLIGEIFKIFKKGYMLYFTNKILTTSSMITSYAVVYWKPNKNCTSYFIFTFLSHKKHYIKYNNPYEIEGRNIFFSNIQLL